MLQALQMRTYKVPVNYVYTDYGLNGVRVNGVRVDGLTALAGFLHNT